MKGSSGKRRQVKRYVSDFIFSDRTGFILDGLNYRFTSEEPGAKFIRFRFQKKSFRPQRKFVFKCIYKMMKNFHLSLN